MNTDRVEMVVNRLNSIFACSVVDDKIGAQNAPD